MAVHLYLMRHGIAEDLGAGGVTRDRDRRLTPKGARRVHGVAEGLRELEIEPELILSSPLVRARETARIVAEVLGIERRLEYSPHLAIPPDSPRLLQQLNALKPVPGSVLLVGHEPHLGELATWLVTGRDTPGIAFRKAGVCCLEVGHLQAGRCATLAWMLPPRILTRLG